MIKIKKYWDTILPLLALLAFGVGMAKGAIFAQIIVALLLIFSVLAAVSHTEQIAHKIGEPWGTIILAIAVTIIETALIISLMIAGGEGVIFLARDTIYSALIIILSGIIGFSLLIGSVKHFEQKFNKISVNIFLVTLIPLIFLSFILPNFTTSLDSPRLTTGQLIFVAIASIVIYSAFLYTQAFRHKNYYTSKMNNKKPHTTTKSSSIWGSLLFLFISLIAVVFLAKSLSPSIEKFIINANLPLSFLGIIIAIVVLLPEMLASIRASYKNDIQTSINLSFGASVATIGLTIPSVAIVSTFFGIDIVLGLDSKSMLLLLLSLLIATLALSKGKTNFLYGVVLVTIFCAFIFISIFP